MICVLFGVTHCAYWPVGFVMPPHPLRRCAMDTLALTLKQRWQVEQQRLLMYRRQRATVHANATRPLEDIVADAEDLDLNITLTLELMTELEDEWLALPKQREAT